MSYYEDGIDKVAANNIFLSSILIDIVCKILLYHLIRLILIYNGFMIINLNFYSIFIRLNRHRTIFMPGFNLRTSVAIGFICLSCMRYKNGAFTYVDVTYMKHIVLCVEIAIFM